MSLDLLERRSLGLLALFQHRGKARAPLAGDSFRVESKRRRALARLIWVNGRTVRTTLKAPFGPCTRWLLSKLILPFTSSIVRTPAKYTLACDTFISIIYVTLSSDISRDFFLRFRYETLKRYLQLTLVNFVRFRLTLSRAWLDIVKQSRIHVHVRKYVKSVSNETALSGQTQLLFKQSNLFR